MLDEPPPDRRPSRFAKPLAILAICVCLFVVEVLVFFFTLCGPNGAGYNRGGEFSNVSAVILLLLFATVLTGVGCLLFIIVEGIRGDD